MLLLDSLPGQKRHDHITPVLASLLWLPVRFEIDFKFLLLTFRALNGPATEYISDLLTWYVHSKALRSADQALLAILRSQLETKG